MLSYSGTQVMDETNRCGLLDDTETFIRDDFGGAITRPLAVTLTTASATSHVPLGVGSARWEPPLKE